MLLNEMSYNNNASYEGAGGEAGSLALGLLDGDVLVSPIAGTIAALTRYEESNVISIVNGNLVVDVFYLFPQLPNGSQLGLQVGQQIQKGQAIGIPGRTAQSGRKYSIVRLKVNGIIVPYQNFPTAAIPASSAPQISTDGYSYSPTPAVQNVPFVPQTDAMTYLGIDQNAAYWQPPATNAQAQTQMTAAGAGVVDPTKIVPDGNNNILYIALIGIVIFGLVMALKNKKK